MGMPMMQQLEYSQARFDVDAKRTKLAKLRGTAGIKVSILIASLDYVLAYMLTNCQLDTLNVAICFMLNMNH